MVVLFLFALQFVEFFHLFGCQEIVDAAKMFTHAAMAELIDFCHQSVKEVAVVAHADECSVKIA